MLRDTSFVQPGMDVVGADLKRVGRVLEAQIPYIRIDRQHLLRHHDLYVPRDAIQEVSESDQMVILSIATDDVDAMGWDQPPSTVPSVPDEAPDGEQRIRDVHVPAVDSIRADEPVRLVHRRMEAEALRSLIVVEEGRPVGVIQWRDIMQLADADAEQPVSAVMHRAFPVFAESMTLDEARAQFGEVDFDRIPVVDAAGKLVGEVMRSAVVLPDQVEPSGMAMTDGMTVVGSAGQKLGTISEVILGPAGQVQAFVVAHGLLGRKHKELPASVIDRSDGEVLMLNIDAPEFKLLADREDRV